MEPNSFCIFLYFWNFLLCFFSLICQLAYCFNTLYFRQSDLYNFKLPDAIFIDLWLLWMAISSYRFQLMGADLDSLNENLLRIYQRKLGSTVCSKLNLFLYLSKWNIIFKIELSIFTDAKKKVTSEMNNS